MSTFQATDPITTGTFSSVPSSAYSFAFPSSTITGSFASSSPAPSSSSSLYDPYFQVNDVFQQISIAMGSFEIGLFLAALTFGIVITKALSYFRTSTDGWLIKSTVVGMLVMNTVQMAATIDAVFSAMVIDFNDLNMFVGSIDNHWSILLQVMLAIYTGAIAQVFFTFRLRSVRKPGMNWLTGFLLFFVTFEVAMGAMSTATFYGGGWLAYLRWFDAGDLWAQIITVGIAAGINLTVAAIAYEWLQKPYVYAKYGKTTFWEELEYWTVKGLFGPFLVTLFIAITLGVMTQSMMWMAGVFMLGNLYTLSVLLTLNTPTPAKALVDLNTPPRPRSVTSSANRTSMATLTDDTELWKDTMKAQKLMASLATTSPKEQEHLDSKLPEYTAGYVVHGSAV